MPMGIEIGIGLAIGGAAFSPASISGLDSGVFVALSRSQGKLWQNAAKTTPATADGDPVRVATCPFSGVDYTAPTDAQRPLLKNTGNYWYLLYDNIDDVMISARTLTSPYTLAGSGLVNSVGASWTLWDGGATNQCYMAKAAAGASSQFDISSGMAGFASSNTVDTANSVTALAVYNAASSVILLGGTETTGTVVATSTTGLTVGARSGFGTLSATRVYSFAAYSGALSASDRAALAAYLAGLAP